MGIMRLYWPACPPQAGRCIFYACLGGQSYTPIENCNAYADRDPNDLPKLVLLDIHLPKVNGLEVGAMIYFA
jgi:hypothetical protein